MSEIEQQIPLVKVAMPPKEMLMPNLERVLYSGMIAEGDYVYDFEKEFANHFGLKNCLAVSSGTAALHLALIMSDVQPGDEVITTSMTAEPTNTTILQVGGIPVFVDIDARIGNLDPDQVECSITDRTKAICVVHYAGYPAEIKKLREIASRHRISLIEDCAHALGAKYIDEPIGSFGDFAIFSFQAIKHITTVDGGMLVIKDANKVNTAKKLRWFGLAKGIPRTEVDITMPGFKYNMNNVAASIGLCQLASVDDLLAKHSANGNFFNREISCISGMTPAYVEDSSNPSYWIYTILSDDADDLEKCLNSNGIMASKLHRPNHFHSIFRPYAKDLSKLENFYRKLIHLPCGWWVTAADRERIIHVLKRG